MTLQILVVEDHGDTRRVLTGLLGHFGHSISAPDNVERALAFLRAKHFDAIVSDLARPDGSGCEVIREAKRRQHLTAVALTADGEDEDVRRGRDAGFDYHLTKPIDLAQLRTVLEQIEPAISGRLCLALNNYFTSSVVIITLNSLSLPYIVVIGTPS